MAQADPTSGSSHPLLQSLEEGAKAAITWNPDWSTTAAVTGQVTCEGRELESLMVYPVFGALGTPIRFYSTIGWLRCDAKGRFSTLPGDPKPIDCVLTGLPVHTDEISLYDYRHRDEREFQLHPGSPNRLEIEVPLSEAQPHKKK